MLHGTDFFTLPTADLARAVAFYRDRMRLTPTMAWGAIGQEFAVGPLTPALLQLDAVGQTFAPAATVIVAWGVSDVEAAVADLTAHGVAFPAPVRDTPVCKMAFCTDTEGNAMMLHRRHDAPPVETGGAPFVVTGIDFFGLPVQDLAGTRRFYEDTLGLTQSNDGAWPEYDIGDLTLCLYEPAKIGIPFAPVETSMVAVHVDDVPASIEALKAAGVTFQGAMIDSGVCHLAPFADPEGNMLMLHHRYTPEE